MNTELINIRLRLEAESETGARLTTGPAEITANDLTAEDCLRQFDLNVSIMRRQLEMFLDQRRLRLGQDLPRDVRQQLSDAILSEPDGARPCRKDPS